MSHKMHDLPTIHSMQHPIVNEEHDELSLLSIPSLFLGNIWSNWCTEKTQLLSFVDAETGKTII